VELLVASLLLCIGLMGLVNTWAFSFRVTQNTDDRGTAYIVARQALERVKMSGFSSTAEGTATTYYTANQATTTSGSAYFTVTTSVVSDLVQSGTAGVAGAVPAPEALRTVTVTVQKSSTGAKLFSTSTYLVRAGI
jgi:Tfp pilus assembly protein PilV